MKINKISLKNFRNYENLDLEFDDNINILIGNNGEGKTNILESIYVLAITKSHRSYIDKNLITTGKEITKITGKISTNSGNKTLEFILNNKGKKVSINNTTYRKISNYISNLLVILFSPDDLEIIKDSPGVRRKFLNIEIGQLDNKYLSYINDYSELVRNRNEYLKKQDVNNIDNVYLEIINNQICDKAIEIYKYRFDFIDKINDKINKIYKKISKDTIKLKYINNIDYDKFDISMKNTLKEKLTNGVKRDIYNGSTYYGPHKDDLEIYLNDEPLKEYGSQGEQRLAVLGIKFAELEIFKDITGEYPILLLDDMLSELDIKKRNKVLKYLNKDVQVFITSTDINDIDKELANNAKIFKIKNGNIKEKNKKIKIKK